MNADKYGLIKPRQYVAELKQISLADLEQQGIQGLIIDLDNTICPWRQNTVIPEADTLIKDALARSYKICLLSNSSALRTRAVADAYGVPFVAPAYKPSRYAFKKAAAGMGLPPNAVAVVGDQLFTDVLGGNRAGCYTILVRPLNDKEFIWTRFMRLLERIVFASWK
ncbi:MAG: YqeG family HAD IIIA-type phosphatase [Clostridia bacterium]|jgi:HAD superfamily phosphatase (TIGR01668 family)|nr:YqeG family HAD IIIA-type phosphatase [Clostridia bacterium]